jgi:hypothetical protein
VSVTRAVFLQVSWAPCFDGVGHYTFLGVINRFFLKKHWHGRDVNECEFMLSWLR